MSVRQLLPIRSRYRAVAFRAIEAILREDPVLAGVVKTWRSREGQPGEMAPPPVDQMPMVGLSPVPKPDEVMTVDHVRVNFAVSVQLFVPGTCVDDILALWEAIEDAIRDDKPFRDATVREFLCSVIEPEGPRGVMMLRQADPAFFPVDFRKPPANTLSQGGVGTLTCFLRRPTRLDTN